MCRLVVTDRATGPIWATTASQAAQSARAMSDGPETVPPGRTFDSSTDRRRRTPVSLACSTVYGRSPGKAASRKSWRVGTSMAGGGGMTEGS